MYMSIGCSFRKSVLIESEVARNDGADNKSATSNCSSEWLRANSGRMV